MVAQQSHINKVSRVTSLNSLKQAKLLLSDIIAILNFQKNHLSPLQKSDRAFLHTSSPMSWAEAEDFCQTMYGHLATDDSAGELRQVIFFFSLLSIH